MRSVSERRSSATGRRQALLQSATTRRRVGRLMVGSALAAMVIVLVATVVLWQVIGTVNQASGETLDVTVDALASMEDTVDLADGLVGSTAESLAAVEVTLDSVSGSFDAGATTVSDVSDLTATAEPTLRSAEATLRTLEGLGGEIDGVLGGLARLPIGVDYDPEAGLGATFGRLADDLEPLPDEFAATSDGLVELGTNLDRLRGDIDRLGATVSVLNQDLTASEDLIDQYRDNIGRARAVAEQSQQDLGRDATLLRVLLLVAAANFALSQLVPLWVGWELLSGPGVPAAGVPATDSGPTV